MKNLVYLFFAALMSFGSFKGTAQCTVDFWGQYPSAALSPACGSGAFGAWSSSPTDAWSREYSLVNVTAGNTYEFQTYQISNNAQRFATITTTANAPLAWQLTTNVTSLTWTATFTGQVRFWTHLNTGCGANTANSIRRVRCSTPPVTTCTGTPNAGTPAISASSGCSGTNFTLSASGLTSGTGITYQWQSAPTATGPWTNIGGATATTLTTSTVANTFYRLVTNCTPSGLSNSSSVVSYTVNTCVGSIILTDSFGDGWNGATMTLNVNGSPFQTFGASFTTGTSQTINFCLPANSSYSLFYTGAGGFPAEVGVSLTINGTNVYSVGAGGATAGTTLSSGVACPPPCTGTPNAGTASISASSGCSGTNFTLSATGLTAGSGITYQWQSGPSATGPWTNIGGATASTLTTSATANTFYRLVTTCTASGLLNTSSVVSYTVNTCIGSITLTDSFGDGWNGATMTLNVNGSPFQTFGASFTTGTSQTINFCLPANSSYSLFYNGAGGFPTEVGVSLTVNGTNVYSVGAGGATVGTTLTSGVACPPPCTGTPNTATASVANSSVCVGESTTLSSTGFSAGSGITYQWQSGPSATGPWTNIGGATATSYPVTGTAGTTFYQLVTTCVNSGLTSASNAVSISGVTCYNVPFTGNTTVNQCSGILYDHGGSIGNYANNANGFTVLTPSTPGNVIQLSGTMNTEATWDFVRVYDGVGIGGTLLWSGSGALAIPTLTSSSGSLTVQFTSDGSVVFSGFQITWVCIPQAPTIAGSASTICSGQGTSVNLTASNQVGTVYWFQGGCNTTGQLATGTTLTVTPTTTTTYFARNFSGGQWSACATYTVTVNPTPTGVNAGTDVSVQCPGTSVPLNGLPAQVPGVLSVVISAPPLGFLDEMSWTLTNSLGTVIGSGGNYGSGSTNTIPISSSASGPYSLFVETQGAFNDNVANYSVICNGSTILTGTVNAGQTTTQAVSSCGTNYTYAWTPSATVASPTSATTTASPLSTTTYTLTVTENGCSASDQMTITVLDNTNPTITAPANVNTFADAGSCNAGGVVLGTPVTSDNCLVASVTNDAPSFFPVGTTTVTWTVTDGFGNTATATQTVIVVDNQNPTITAPAAVSVNADPGLCSASSVVLGNPGIADNCSVVSIVNNAPGIFPVGSTTVTWTIADASGNTASAIQTVTVLDNQLPTITAPSNITPAADPGLCTASGVNLGSPIVADNCGIATVTNNAPAIFPDGPTTVTWTVTDLSGNSSTATQTVTVVDTQAPLPICQNVFVDLNASGNASVTAAQVNNGSTDNCSIASTVLSQTSFSCSNVGVNPVTLTVTDNTGNISTCSAFVIVSDITAPVAVCQNVTLNLDPVTGAGTITPAQVNNNSTDACGIASLSLSQTNFSCANLGANSVTLTVLDVNGNSSTCTSTITVIDNTTPSFNTTPSNISQNSVLGNCGRVITYAAPTFFDACSATMTQTDGSGLTSGDFFPVGVTNQTYTITDPSGNTTSYTFTVTIVDNQLPVITNCPANMTLAASPTSCNALANWTAPSGSDNCPGVVVTSTHAPGSLFPVGTTTVTYTATDASNNQATCSFTVTVLDNTGPFVASLPTVTGQCNAVVTAPVVVDNCTGSVTGTTSDPLVYSNQGTYFVNWTFTDANGNTSTAVQVVIVQDNTDPIITAPAPLTVSANASCAATGLTLGTPTTSDNCSAVTVTNNAPAVYPIGTTIVTWTATDAVGNTSTASQIITVLDNTIPTITAPANITLNASASCNVTGVSLGNPVTSDNCGVSSVVNNAPSSFPVGTTQVTWTVIDNAGNSTSAIQTVTVIDVTNPTITAPAAVTLNANASCVAFNANLGSPITSDNCTVASITNNAPSVFPLGNTTVTWTVTDASGNTATATQLVTVIDVVSPTITAPATVTIGTNNACTATGVNLGTASASDNCGSVTITNNAPTTFPLGSTTVTWTATDAAGNSSTASQIVVIVDQTNPTIVAPADINVNASASCIVTNVTLGNPSVGDNCGVASVTNNAPTSFPIGTTLITWTVTDNAGNTATSIQTVSVVDNTNPTIIAPAAVTVNANSSCVAFNVNLGSPVTADNCSVASVSNNAPSVFPLGTTTVIWTVTDAAGNTSTANQVVTVIDVINPAITAPTAITVTANNGCTATGVVLGNAIASDNCSSVTITNNAPASFQLGNTTVVWTATDAAGNVSTANQVVTVIDQTNPIITAPVNITVNAGNSCTISGIVLGFPVVADNCGVANIANDAPSTFPIGTTLVTWTIIDNAGNTATSTQTVTVVDNTNPIITAPANVTVDANSSCVAFNVNLGSPITSDNCAVVSITNDAPSVFELGATTVTWTVTDASGNSSTAAQTVTVLDNIDPEIIAPANLQVIANADCSATGVILGNPIATDNCSGVTVQNNAPAVFPVGSTVVTWTATDASGNSSTAQQTITVTDNVNPTVLLQDLTVTLDDNGDAQISFNDVDAGTFDNCGIASTVLSQTDFSCADIGVNNVSVTVVDNSGNVSLGTVSITVQSNGVDSDFDGIDDSCDDEDNEVVADVPEAFTPNGNNINDLFEIKNITTFNERKLEVFNRYGMSVYANDQYDNTWDGTRKDNGQALPDGTYYYVLTLDGEIKKGFVYINRVKQ